MIELHLAQAACLLVEGMERDVVLGARRTLARHRPTLYLECGHEPERARPLVDTLRALGYVAHRHTPPLFNPDNFRGEVEDISPRLASINLLALPRERVGSVPGLTLIEDP